MTETEIWSKWESQVVNGTFPLRRFLGRSNHSVVFLTEYRAQNLVNAAIKIIPADPARAVLFVGQAQVMTPMGAVPISFELDATKLAAAVEKFGATAELAVQQTMRELQELRREQASSLVIPDAAGAGMPNPSDLLRGGRPRR